MTGPRTADSTDTADTADSAARLARRLADYTVLAHDPAVPAATAGYWELSRAAFAAVDGRTRAVAAAEPGARAAHSALVAAPADPQRHRALAERLAPLLGSAPEPERAALAALVARSDGEIWLDHHLGDRHAPGAAGPDTAALRALAAGARDRRAGERPADGPSVHVVVPFRDRTRGGRTRNLLACLLALHDQDYRDGPLRITVVETDDRPYARELVEPLVDRYLFAAHEGRFNKSWTVNLGLAADRDRSALTCVLDADILADRSFVRRNARRLTGIGHTAHVCCDRSLSLDAPATATALARRCVHGEPDVPLGLLRGVLLREPPGGALWARTGALHRIGGFDERFEGWGGEDEDVVRRLAADGELRRFDDPLLHLDHPRPAMRTDGDLPFNAHLRPGSWSGSDDYGDPHKYAPHRYAPLAFTGTPRPPGPLMWGQRLLWNDSRWMGEEAHYFNLHVSVPVPPGRDLPTALACLGRLVHRHEALRSRVVTAPDGTPRQEVPAAGTVEVLIAPAAPGTADEVLDRHRARLLGRTFALDEEWPVRPCVVTVDGAPARITLVLSHVLADGGAAAVLTGELAALLADGPSAALPEPVPQPLDRAAYETSPAGRKLSEAGLARTAAHLRAMPPTNFPGPLLPPDRYRFRRMEMCSPALTEALRRIADRHRTGTSAVLLAAVATALATATGNRTVAFKTVLGNRVFPELAPLVGNALSNAVVPAEIGDGTFGALVRAVVRSSMGNLLHSQCDPDARDALTARIGLERGVHLNLSTFFNDVRAGLEQPVVPRPELDLAALSERTRTGWIGAWERQDATFFFHSRTVGDCPSDPTGACDHVYAMVDTAHLAADRTDPLLRAVERIAVRAAGGDLPLPDLTAAALATGLTPPDRGPEWLHLDHCTVHPADVRAAVAAALPDRPAEVFVEDAPDGHRLVAHVACADPAVGPADLHRAVVAALPGFPAAVAPHHYVLHPVTEAAAPGRSREDWERLPVRASGSGRPAPH
ncbi:condensation domain-containing protein [Kitasatospora phosalacinea]|uniref:Condensation domain-containing protein n=1 Tax=Kitasatospora phosalacinea TaxID=2065 RepID=A0ABW6GL95_9ACTN